MYHPSDSDVQRKPWTLIVAALLELARWRSDVSDHSMLGNGVLNWVGDLRSPLMWVCWEGRAEAVVASTALVVLGEASLASVVLREASLALALEEAAGRPKAGSVLLECSTLSITWRMVWSGRCGKKEWSCSSEVSTARYRFMFWRMRMTYPLGCWCECLRW